MHGRTWWGDALVLIFAVVSLTLRRQPLGLGVNALSDALKAWRIMLLMCGAAVIAGCFLGDKPDYLLARGVVYFAWCIVQQIMFQLLIYRRLRSVLGPGWASAVLSGVLFAIVHLPNPVLVPATFVWGTIATRLFERHPSVVAIALLQTLLSSLLIWLTPVEWHHQFRVGPGYWRF